MQIHNLQFSNINEKNEKREKMQNSKEVYLLKYSYIILAMISNNVAFDKCNLLLSLGTTNADQTARIRRLI